MNRTALHRKRLRSIKGHVELLGGMVFCALAVTIGIAVNTIPDLIRLPGWPPPIPVTIIIVVGLYFVTPLILVNAWRRWFYGLAIARRVTRCRGGAVCPMCDAATNPDATRCPGCNLKRPPAPPSPQSLAATPPASAAGLNPATRLRRRTAILRELAALRVAAWGTGVLALVFLSTFGGDTFSFAGFEIGLPLVSGTLVERVLGWSIVAAIVLGPPVLFAWVLRRWLMRFVAARWYVLTTRPGPCPLCRFDFPADAPFAAPNCPECGLRRRLHSRLAGLADAINLDPKWLAKRQHKTGAAN